MAFNPMTLKKIRETVAYRAGKELRSQKQIDLMNAEINNALAFISGDCADAFSLQPVKIDLVAVHDLKAQEVTIDTVSGLPSILNDRIIKIENTDGTDLNDWVPAVDGTWDGRMWLRVMIGDDTYLLQTREWFTFDNQGTIEYYVSLVDPLPFSIPANGFDDLQVFQPYMWFPSDTHYIKHHGSDDRGYLSSIKVLNPVTAKTRVPSYRHELATGSIVQLWRSIKHIIKAPLEAPVVTDSESSTWSTTAYPKVEAEICYTYVWGRKTSKAHGEAPSSWVDPLWESGPSPVASFTMTAQTTAAQVLQATNIDAQLGFSHTTLNGLPWEGKSGMRIRFYVRIKNLVSSSGDARYERIETSDRFMLLAEIEPTDKIGTKWAAFEWDGTTIPDYERVLAYSPGYYGFSMYPLPDSDQALDFDIRQIPEQLTDDNMVVQLQLEGREAFIQFVLYSQHQADGKIGESAASLNLYDRFAEQLRARYGNSGGTIMPRGQGIAYIGSVDPTATQET